MRSLTLLFLVAALASTASAALPSSVMVSAAQDRPDKPWSNYPTTVVSDLQGFKPGPAESLSPYGGWRARTFTATGFFHTVKTPQRWWLVDPDGCAFVLMGVVDVNVASAVH